VQINIISIAGGLGNQMFQYAYFLALKAKNPYTWYYVAPYFRHNGYELDRIFNIPKKQLQRSFLRLLKKAKPFLYRNHDENFGTYKPYPKTKKKIIYHSGYWQSEKYFIEIEDKIRSVFQFPVEKLNDESKEIVQQIKQTNSVSLHVRRGDYYSDPGANTLLGNVCTARYYQEAIENILDKFNEKAEFYVFSDEPYWVQQNLYIPNAHYIYWNTKADCWMDMYLMSQCKHNIIANSSFSWWGSLLNINKDRCVIGPKNWFNNQKTNDVLVKNWIKN
jgi:tellurite resistance-related uncharacterized protein